MLQPKNSAGGGLPEKPGGALLKASGLALCLLAASALAGRADELCSSCDPQVIVSGEFDLARTPNPPAVTGAAPGDAAAFQQEISGKHFSLVLPHLTPGRYTAVIGLAETLFDHAGARIFDISCGNRLLAGNLDIFALSGGFGKACFITNQIDFSGEAQHGPLTFSFSARVNDAKFNTFELRNAAGQPVVARHAADLIDSFDASAMQAPVVTGPEIWRDPSQAIDARVHDLVRRLSLAEKVRQLGNNTPAIPRLGIPAYNYWNEALHGVARAGVATVFPQAIGAAATWDVPLIHSEAQVISIEARAKYNDYVRAHDGNADEYHGLTFWSPNLNIFRDPRWGRGQETYGEDTFLTGSIGVAFIRGLQGDDPEYIRAMACAKHFAVHSGPEPTRHQFDAEPSERDLYETYLPHFEMAVREGHVGGVMGSYNSVLGVPACASSFLLGDILRKQWGFDGYIVSDCGAINDVFAHHKYVATPEEAAAVTIKAGCDICCGNDYNALTRSVKRGLVSPPEIDGALTYVLKTRFRLGLFNPPGQQPFTQYPITQNDTPAHEALALSVARESMVLLKNNGLLPLNRAKFKRIAVIGMNAGSLDALVGNYNGTPARPVTILDGIKYVAGTNIAVTYAPGCPLALHQNGSDQPDPSLLKDAIAAAKAAEVVIYVGGIDARLEGEESADASTCDGFKGGDRTRIELPPGQTELLQALVATGKPVVFVNCSGSAIAMPWAAKNLPAIVQAWYPGEQGGRAVGEVLFGDYNPAGRLPVTFYNATTDLPAFEDYAMTNRTYRFFNGQPEFAFGHGLSYTKFTYQNAGLNESNYKPADTVRLVFELKNSGGREGDEVAQVYFRHVHSAVPQPKLALCAFTRVHVAARQAASVTLDIPVAQFRQWDPASKQYVVESGKYELLVGAASDDIRLRLPLKIAAAELKVAAGK
ncbi:MAG: glycoside hydrolase family 3 C-terminal domain-containing protein [Verrucomicrobiae bacterium]|nr:glycoside hydrolase family 3 C-terminal domain-containing protein [Verrucomicrobiae bacterium]